MHGIALPPTTGCILGPDHRPGGGLHPHAVGFHLPAAPLLRRGQQARRGEIRPLPLLLHPAVHPHPGGGGRSEPGDGRAQTRAGYHIYTEASLLFNF